MRKLLWRFGAIVMILAGTMALNADPAACGGAGCGRCGWECVGISCADDLGAHPTDVCNCDDPVWCETETNWDCPPV